MEEVKEVKEEVSQDYLELLEVKRKYTILFNEYRLLRNKIAIENIKGCFGESYDELVPDCIICPLYNRCKDKDTKVPSLKLEKELDIYGTGLTLCL